MPNCVLMTADGKMSEIKIDKKYLPTADDIENEFLPKPYLQNLIIKPNCVKYEELFGSTRLQWCQCFNFPEIRILFAASPLWTAQSVLETLLPLKVNPKATYICKHREIFGAALFFKLDEAITIDLMNSIVLPGSSHKFSNDECVENAKVFNIDQSFPLAESMEDRLNIVNTYVRDICLRRFLITLETMFLNLLPSIYKQYVQDGKAYYVSIADYCLSYDKRYWATYIRFENGAKKAEDTNYMYRKADQYPEIRPVDYDENVKLMSERYGKYFKAPLLTSEEEEIKKKKDEEFQIEKRKYLDSLKNKRSKELQKL